jgi:hypothetical protein
MRRRAFLGVVAILTLLLAAAGSALALLVHHIPAYYARNALPEGPTRQCLGREFVGRSSELWSSLSGDRPWELTFTQDQFNSYLQEEDEQPTAQFVEIPETVHDIRVAMEDDRLRVGFRYGAGWCSSVITVEFRVWLVARHTNMIALELCAFRAGALPLGTQTLLDYITEAGRKQDIDVTWYRHQGHPVAVFQLQANQPRPTFQLSRLEVQPGRLIIKCGPTQPAAAPPAEAAVSSAPAP